MAPSLGPRVIAVLSILLLHPPAGVLCRSLTTADADQLPKACSDLFAAKLRRWTKRFESRRAAMSEAISYKRPKFVYDIFEPEWDCEVQDRVGKAWGDGGKFVCGVDALAELGDGCLVYSIGSRLDVTFEKDILSRTKCEVHTFDHTVNASRARELALQTGFTYHPIGLSSSYAKKGRREYVTSLHSIMKRLGHEGRRIDVLKIDCEGCEHQISRSIFQACSAGSFSIGQMQIEVHGTDWERTKAFFDGADSCGLMIFHKERNHWGCGGYRCVEFSLVSQAWARTAFARSHCPNQHA